MRRWPEWVIIVTAITAGVLVAVILSIILFWVWSTP
jgi:hypothetical protein